MSGLYMESQAPYNDSEAVPKTTNLFPVPCIKIPLFFIRLPATDIIARKEAGIRVHKNQYYRVSRD